MTWESLEPEQQRLFAVVMYQVVMLLAYSYYKTRESKRHLRHDRKLVYDTLRNVDELKFKQNYRVTMFRFNSILHDFGWKQGMDAADRVGIYPTVKLMAALRALASGARNADLEDVFHAGRSTLDANLKLFCEKMIELYSEKYLKPDWKQVLAVNKRKHGLNGLLGSLDCTHLKWEMCPAAYKGIYSGRSGKPSIILEAIADADLRVVHAFVGYPGNNNDVTVLRGNSAFRTR